MRFLRKLIGLGMVMVGVPALVVGAAGWLAAGHRDPNGAFTAELAPLRGSGPVVVVPDVADVLARHRAGWLLTPGPVRADLAVGAEASLVVGIRPGWLDPAARGLLLGGGLLLVVGLLVLFWRTAPRDRVRPDHLEALPSSHDRTGERVPVRGFEFDEFESVSGFINGVRTR